MDRRSFIAVSAAALIPKVETEPNPGRRVFERFDYAADKWVPIDPMTIKAGDVVWIRDEPPSEHMPGNGRVVRITENNPTNREMYSDLHIDPATNQWVSEQLTTD